MNRFKLSYILFFIAAIICTTSCDETTDDIGAGLAGNMDNFIVTPGSFEIKSQTKMLGAVQCRSTKANLGCIRDYDTGSVIRGSYSTQFYLHKKDIFPALDSVRSTSPKFSELADTSHITIDQVVSDSSYLYIIPSKILGDSLQPLHLNVYELSKPIPDGKTYFSDFDPVKEGYVNTSKPLKSMTFTMADQSIDSITTSSSSYTPIIKIMLNDEYVKDGVTYPNFGTYIMRRYYQSKQNGDGAFSSINSFLYDVFPGIYVSVDNGEGAMATVSGTGLNIAFKYYDNTKKQTLAGHTTLFGTEEVLQTTRIETNQNALQKMAENDSCTYLKSPAGLYTELTIPIDDIMSGHETDSISKAAVTLQCMISKGFDGKAYSAPSNVLMLPADSVQAFFNEKKLTDGRKTFLASYNSTTSSYTFENFSGMITFMNNLKKSGKAGENWNKVAIIPVSVSTTSSSTSSSGYYGYYSSSSSSNTITAISPEMSLSSAKLVGGAKALRKTDVSVVYTKMSE